MKRVFSLINLGCPKNLVDSEVIMGILINNGFIYTDDLNIAEIIIVNTCGFIKTAKRESLETIRYVVSFKKRGVCKKIIVVGCLVQLEGNKLKELIPDIDSLISINEIPEIIDRANLRGNSYKLTDKICNISKPVWIYDGHTPRVLTGKPYYTYLKIADGCNHSCSFCIIPKIKGPYRSRNIESILKEAKGLELAGIKELILISQDCSYYGLDEGNNDLIIKLLNRLVKLKGINWIRLLYLYPDYVTDKLIDIIGNEKRICRYFDIPFQHCSENILRLMKRGGNRGKYIRLVEKIRKNIPEASLRTTLIVGFPGETDKDFEELVSFCEEAEFNNLGVFIYYDEDKADSFNLKDKITYKEKLMRKKILLEKQKEILKKINKRFIGKVVEAVIDDIKDDKIQLRYEGMAPEIDGVIYVKGTDIKKDKKYKVGDFVKVKLIENKGYDFLAKLMV